jgi:DNA-binding transcriptional ArsR family regulator
MNAADIDPKAMQRVATDAVQMLKELANENRLMIMCALSETELSVSELNERIDLSQSALSQHLARLRAQGLVQTRRKGQTIFYSLPESEALDIIRLLHDLYCPTI